MIKIVLWCKNGFIYFILTSIFVHKTIPFCTKHNSYTAFMPYNIYIQSMDKKTTCLLFLQNRRIRLRQNRILSSF